MLAARVAAYVGMVAIGPPARQVPTMEAREHPVMTFANPSLPVTRPSSSLPRHAYRRGTRGFAAFVVALAGFVVLGIGAVVLPSIALDRLAMSWLIPLSIAFGLAHFVVALGLVRRSEWSPSGASYLAAIGIGVAAYGLLVTLTGLDPFGATSSLPGDQARAEGVGLLLWMIGLWTVGARFAIRGFRRP